MWEKINMLMDHVEERQRDSEEWQMFQETVVAKIKKILPESEQAEVNRLIGIICTNSVSFQLHSSGVYGRALYPTLSLVSHNCVANARYTVNPDDLSVVLRAKKEIAEGEEISINYIPPIYGQPHRGAYIREDWYFNCQCLRCQDVTEFGTMVSAVKCADCREGLILPDTNKKGSVWSCRFCSNPFSPSMIEETVQRIEDELLALIEDSHSVKEVESFIRKNSHTLHQKHYLNLIAQRNIIQLLAREENICRENVTKSIKYCKAFKATMSRLDPGLSEWRGYIQKTLNKAQLELLKMNLQEKKMDHNSFSQESEKIWASMREVDQCQALCRPLSRTSSTS